MYNNYGYAYNEPRADQPMGYPTPQVGYSWGLGYTQQPQHQAQQGLAKAPSKVYGTEWNPSAYGYGNLETTSQQPLQPQQRPSTSGSSAGGASQYSEYQKYYYQSALQSTSPAAKPQQQRSSHSFGGYGGLQASPQSTTNKWWTAPAATSSAASVPAAPAYSYNTSQYVTAAKNYYGRKQQDTPQPFSQYLDEYSSQQRYVGGAAGRKGGTESGANGQKRTPIVRKPPVDMSKFFCDVCKIQCGSDQVSSSDGDRVPY